MSKKPDNLNHNSLNGESQIGFGSKILHVITRNYLQL